MTPEPTPVPVLRNGHQAIREIVETLSNVSEYLYTQDRLEMLRYGDKDTPPGRSRLSLRVEAAENLAIELSRTMAAASMELTSLRGRL